MCLGAPHSPSLGPGGTTYKKRSGLLYLPKAGAHSAQGFSSRGQSGCPQHQKGRGPLRSLRLGSSEGAKLSRGSPGALPSSNQACTPPAQGAGSPTREDILETRSSVGGPEQVLSGSLFPAPLPVPYIPSTRDPLSTRVPQGQPQPHITWSQRASLPCTCPLTAPRGGQEGSTTTDWGLTSLTCSPACTPKALEGFPEAQTCPRRRPLKPPPALPRQHRTAPAWPPAGPGRKIPPPLLRWELYPGFKAWV